MKVSILHYRHAQYIPTWSSCMAAPRVWKKNSTQTEGTTISSSNHHANFIVTLLKKPRQDAAHSRYFWFVWKGYILNILSCCAREGIGNRQSAHDAWEHAFYPESPRTSCPSLLCKPLCDNCTHSCIWRLQAQAVSSRELFLSTSNHSFFDNVDCLRLSTTIPEPSTMHVLQFRYHNVEYL